MSNLIRQSAWAAKSLDFFEEFRELSERRRFQKTTLRQPVELSNPVCGDLVSVEVSLCQGRVSAIGYQQRGCWPVVGCLELLGELCLGACAEEVLAFRLDEFLSLVNGVPASKRHAFSLTHRAVLQSTGLAMADKNTARP